jgi:hypothetical protein
MNTVNECPFSIGDTVRFTPSERTRGHYQNLERFGVKPNDELKIERIENGMYLYFKNGAGGWPWNEFTLVHNG